jgi:hypothetical protein
MVQIFTKLYKKSLCTRARFLFMKNYWDLEWDVVQKELAESEDPKEILLHSKIDKVDNLLVEKLIKLYLERCSFINGLAFFQNKSKKGSFSIQISVIFHYRSNYLSRILKKIVELNSK